MTLYPKYTLLVKFVKELSRTDNTGLDCSFAGHYVCAKIVCIPDGYRLIEIIDQPPVATPEKSCAHLTDTG
jgi:hypothetical protein